MFSTPSRAAKLLRATLAVLITLVALSSVLPGAAFIARAQTGQATGAKPADKKSTVPCPNGQKGECIPLENPLEKNTTDLTVILGWIIKAALGLMGSLALFMLIWGGFQWLTSAGNPDRVSAGTKTMLFAALGIVVVLSSYLIISTYLQYLTGAR